MLGGVFVLRWLAGGFPNHFEAHARRSSKCVESGPLRLVGHRHVFHLECERVSVRSDVQATVGDGNDPVEPGGGNGRGKIGDLVLGGNLSPEQRKSYVGESSVLRGTRRPVIAGHDAVIGGGAAKWDSISLVVGAHPCECAATRYFSFEVVNMRRLEIRSSRLIVAAVFVEPWNRVWIGVPVCSDGYLIRESVHGGRRYKWYRS